MLYGNENIYDDDPFDEVQDDDCDKPWLDPACWTQPSDYPTIPISQENPPF